MSVGSIFTEEDTGMEYEYNGYTWNFRKQNKGNGLLLSGLTTEIQTDWAKNTAADTEKTAVKITVPEFPVSTYKATMKNPSVDTALTVRLFNRRTFTETGTGFAAGSDGTHIQLSAEANPTDDYYNTFIITITGGTGEGQTRIISDYVGNTQIAQVSVAFVTAPGDDSTYSIAMVTDSLAWSNTFAKASLTVPISLATDSALITGMLFDNGCDVYYVVANDDLVVDADASRFTSIFQLIPIL
jgi:hypothetical protein